MRLRVVRLQQADEEIVQIATYLAEHSLPAAERFLLDLEMLQDRLAQFPNSGAAGLIPGTRRLVIGNYIVSYRQAGDAIQIFAVRDGRRRDARF